ncbi:FkbM family methyltransferase [Chloroflexota bacterium]
MSVNQCALGEKAGVARIDITNLPNIDWATMVPGFMSDATRKESIEDPVCRLDEYLEDKILSKISMIKIDTEGYEFHVLRGLQNYFESTDHRPIIICEVAPSAYPLLESTLENRSSYLKQYSYDSFDLIRNRVKIDITKLKNTSNVLFRAPA